MVNKTKYPRDMSFVNRQGNVVHPNRETYHAKKSTNAGKAYGFFDCDATKEEIEREIPSLRHDARNPKGLQLLLHEGISELQFDKALTEKIQYPDDYRIKSSKFNKQDYEEEDKPLSKMKYVLEANYEGASNENTASEVGDLLNVFHYEFNKDQSFFRGAVIYKENGEYLFRK